MKAFKYILMVLLLLANLVFAQSSFADAPNFSKDPDYKALMKEINQLRATKDAQGQLQGYTPEQIDKKLNELELEKYALESGINWGQCQNETGKTLAVYGPIPANVDEEDYPYDTGLYFLADGQTTINQWDCQGVYLPSDVQAIAPTLDGQNQELAGGVVVKVPKGTKLVLKSNQNTGAIELNTPVTQLSQPGEVKWFIPNVTQAFLDTRTTDVPTDTSAIESDSD